MVEICDDGIEVAVVVEVTEAQITAVGIPESEPRIGEGTVVFVHPGLVGLLILRDHGIKVTVVINVAKGNSVVSRARSLLRGKKAGE